MNVTNIINVCSRVGYHILEFERGVYVCMCVGSIVCDLVVKCARIRHKSIESLNVIRIIVCLLTSCA